MVARFLVTTALEDTWPAEDVPVLFLGEWCRRYVQKSAWEKRDAVVAPYHWDNREKLQNDYLYLQSLYEELLKALATRLNELHSVNHSVRYWRILVGPWLGYFTQMLFDRWAMVKQVMTENKPSGVRVLRHNDGDLVPNDMESFTPLFIGDVWNESIYGQILDWMGVPVERVDVENNKLVTTPNGEKTGPIRQIKRNLARVADYISGILRRDNEYFFISSYLGIKQDLLLQAKLGQLPKLWRPVAVPIISFNDAARQWEFEKINTVDEFSGLVCALIPRNIPKAYLEGYQELVALTEKLPWPKLPKVIFTSNSYSADDVFKVWAAAKVENGVPLVIGQHGGNYGMAKWSFHEEHEIAISDRYLTWGWGQDDNPKLEPVGNIINFGKRVTPDDEGVILMVEMMLPRHSYHMYSVPAASQWLDYFEDQCRFVMALPERVRDHLLVRLFPQEFGWDQRQRWEDRFKNIKIDAGSQSMKSAMEKSRVCICTYNATTYLESMSLNFPTIIFWNPRHWELRNSALPYFERLKEVGIFHDTPESAARQLELVWSDVSGWWQSAEVQAVRHELCSRFAYIPERPLNEMEEMLRRMGRRNNKASRPIMDSGMH